MSRLAHDFLADQLPSDNADINETLKILRDAIATDDIVSNYRQSSWPWDSSSQKPCILEVKERKKLGFRWFFERKASEVDYAVGVG